MDLHHLLRSSVEPRVDAASLVGSSEGEPLGSAIDNVVSVGNAVLDVADPLAQVGSRYARADVDWFLLKTRLRRHGMVRLARRGIDLTVGYEE